MHSTKNQHACNSKQVENHILRKRHDHRLTVAHCRWSVRCKSAQNLRLDLISDPRTPFNRNPSTIPMFKLPISLITPNINTQPKTLIKNTYMQAKRWKYLVLLSESGWFWAYLGREVDGEGGRVWSVATGYRGVREARL